MYLKWLLLLCWFCSIRLICYRGKLNILSHCPLSSRLRFMDTKLEPWLKYNNYYIELCSGKRKLVASCNKYV